MEDREDPAAAHVFDEGLAAVERGEQQVEEVAGVFAVGGDVGEPHAACTRPVRELFLVP